MRDLLPTFSLPLVLGGMLAGSPAAAQDYPARDVGGWTVAASKDRSGCFVTRTYDGAGSQAPVLASCHASQGALASSTAHTS